MGRVSYPVSVITPIRPNRLSFYWEYVRPAIEVQGVSQIVAYVDHRRLGAASARNFAASLANQPWILFVDDDTVLSSKCVATMCGSVASYHSKIVVSDYAAFCSPGVEHPRGPSWVHSVGLEPGDRWGRAVRKGPICDVTSMMTRDLFEKAGGFDEELDRFIDWDLFIRIAELEPKLSYIPRVCFHKYYLAGGSITEDVDYHEARRKVEEKHGL